MTTTESKQAKSWRLAHGWTLEDLAERTGFSYSSILWFERGCNPVGQPTNEFAFFRYKRICQAIEAGLDPDDFKWGT